MISKYETCGRGEARCRGSMISLARSPRRARRSESRDRFFARKRMRCRTSLMSLNVRVNRRIPRETRRRLSHTLTYERLQKETDTSRHRRRNQPRWWPASMSTGTWRSRQRCIINWGVCRRRRRISGRKWGIWGACHRRRHTRCGRPSGTHSSRSGTANADPSIR